MKAREAREGGPWVRGGEGDGAGMAADEVVFELDTQLGGRAPGPPVAVCSRWPRWRLTGGLAQPCRGGTRRRRRASQDGRCLACRRALWANSCTPVSQAQSMSDWRLPPGCLLP